MSEETPRIQPRLVVGALVIITLTVAAGCTTPWSDVPERSESELEFQLHAPDTIPAEGPIWLSAILINHGPEAATVNAPSLGGSFPGIGFIGIRSLTNESMNHTIDLHRALPDVQGEDAGCEDIVELEAGKGTAAALKLDAYLEDRVTIEPGSEYEITLGYVSTLYCTQTTVDRVDLSASVTISTRSPQTRTG